ncbi:MAG: DUF1501 domain-containing protein, partial [Verrucomicrobia bacterium]|nr:DUF1501 domain-containing protein [Verrucomicrobiota bacterium]
MHCQRFQPAPFSRRDLLRRCALGFGGVALHALMHEEAMAAVSSLPSGPLAPRTPHFAPRAINVIFLYMDG